MANREIHKGGETMIAVTERIIMRHIPILTLKRAYEQMIIGGNHNDVCTTLRIDPNVINGNLKAAVEEALWERGHFASKELLNEFKEKKGG
jgi:hypothetical protein